MRSIFIALQDVARRHIAGASGPIEPPPDIAGGSAEKS
jgi:hypothetical protein